MDVTEKMHYIKRELFVIVVFALLVNCLSITINATTASEIPDTHDEFLFCKMGDADFDNRVTAADARIVLRTSVGLQSVTPDRLFSEQQSDSKKCRNIHLSFLN